MQQTHNLPKVSSILTIPIGQFHDCPLDLSGLSLYNYRVINTDDDYYFQVQERHINTLRSAVGGDFYLDVKNPKLYKKIRKFYENNGVEFSGDPLDDYDILIDCIAEDLASVEVA